MHSKRTGVSHKGKFELDMRKQFFTRRTKQAAKGGGRTALPLGFSEQNFQK